MKDWTAETVRVPLTITPEELAELDGLVAQLKTRTRTRLIRQAIKFYGVLAKYKADGYMIQAIKQGSLMQFPDLDVPYPKDMRAPDMAPRVKRKTRTNKRKVKGPPRV